MSRNADFSEFEKFAKSWQKTYDDFDDFLRKFLLEMALRAIAKIRPRTPVDTGALRNMWVVGEIKVAGNNFEIEISNGMDYASFVEYGHRTTGGSWVDGRFMMTISIDEVNAQMPVRFHKAFREYLESKGAV